MPTHSTRVVTSRKPPSSRHLKLSRNMSVWTAVAVCFLAGMAPLARAIQVTVVCADLVGAGGVGIRVWPTLKASPERHSKTMHFRLLQVNWEAERLLEGDWVGVFEDDPRPPHLRPLPTSMPPTSNRDWRAPQPLFWDTPFATQGTITSNYTELRVELSVLARGGCVGPYAGFVRNGVCVAAECLASHPTWLYDHRAVLGSRSLRSLVLPGTHNAGSYSIVDDRDYVASWVVCQDEDIISQLLYGNRYLDLRVGYYPDTQELLWVNHDVLRWRPLQDVLDGVRGFLALSPDPVIIDIHRTPMGFEFPGALELLLSLMNTTLGAHFVDNRHGPHVTLDDLWQMGKRVVFTFIDPTVSDHTPWVWPPLPQAWANAQLLDDLRTFLDAEMNKRFESPRLWAAMAHLTPTFWDLVLRSRIGVRGFTDRVSFSITRWLRQRWGHMANIVASDFFRGNDIINVAIRNNLALSMCRPSDPSRHPYTLRWTTELALRPGSPSTTIPPFVRKMYSGGALWSTTGVRQIHYPFIPIDANISMVFTAIPNRIPSVAPGVTYQYNRDMWRQIFHYATDGSPQPPEATAPRPDNHQPSSSFRAAESLPKAGVEVNMTEWDGVNGQDFLDEAFSDGVRDGTPANKINPRKADTTEPPAIQGDGVNRVSAPLSLPRDLGNTESYYDEFNTTNSMPSTSNATLDQDQAFLLTLASLFPIGGSSIEDESTLLTSNTEHDNDSLSLMSNDTLDDYSLADTNNETQNNSLSSITTPTSSVAATIQNITSQSTINSKLDGSYLPASDDANSTSHSTPVQNDDPMMFSTPRVPQEQSQIGVGPALASGITHDVWPSDGAVQGNEPSNDLITADLLVPPLHLASGDSTEQRQVSEPSTQQIDASATTIHPSFPRVKAQATAPAVTIVTVLSDAPTVRVPPSTVTLSAQSGAPTTRVQHSTSTVRVQPSDATLTADLRMFDLTATKSSSQVT